MTFERFAAAWLPEVESAFEALLPPAARPKRCTRRCVRMFPGGKRLRPLLALLGAEAMGGDPAAVLRAAAGIECLHTYSLVHDDLPCMDDDDLRRGRPTCHKVHGEAMALLAGDALLTLAFEAVAAAGGAAVAALARGAGSVGMVGGQVEDLAAEGADLGCGDEALGRVRWIHDHKTGTLITASLFVGAHAAAGDALPAAVVASLQRYGESLGRAFQIADDCLDLTGTAAELGKNPLADVALAKLTWPALIGLEPSLATARALADAARAEAVVLTDLAREWRALPHGRLDGARALLQDVASFAVERRR
ncbi:MAG: polyprenyl synthetase family protein [Planctomycetota bacterium]